MRTIAIVQATMSLGKWYGGVFEPLAGKPVLWHVFHRARKCCLLDAIAIVTSTDQLDDSMEWFAVKQGVDIVRTSTKSTLQRFAVAADKLRGDVVVCVAGNAPFIDPGTVDMSLEALMEQHADFCISDSSGSLIAQGFEVVSARALKKLAAQDHEAEKSLPSIKSTGTVLPDFPQIAKVEFKREYRLGGVSMLVNSPTDLAFLQAISDHFKAEAGAIDIRDVIRLLRFRQGMKDPQNELDASFSKMLFA
ncbi:MAG: NTP transferase domain-containing protein [Proteobacteria bacterium]|nr:NTP transferase domain-containing protein [Pseudomonadota bacterium]